MSALRMFLCTSIAFALGCGGSESTVGDGGSTGSSSSGASTSSGGSSGSSGSGSSGGMGSSTSGGGSSSGSVQPVDDSGLPTVGPDGSLVTPPPPPSDAGTTPPTRDGGGGGRTTPPPPTDGGPNQTVCGTTTCDSATQICCLATRTCIAPNATCRGSTLTCSGSNSCAAGDVCCQETTSRTTSTSKCVATKCPAGAIQLCTTNADCSGTDVCRPSGTDYGYCAPPAMPPPTRDGGVIFRGDAGH